MSRQKSEWPDKTEVPESQYVTVTMISRRTGLSRAIIRGTIERGELSGVKVSSKYNSSGFEWNVRLEDAETYIQKLALEAGDFPQEAEEPPEKLALEEEKLALPENVSPRLLGTPEECGCCGLDTGNILGDINGLTREQYGYLCHKCYKLVQMFHADTQRMEKVLAYLKITRK